MSLFCILRSVHSDAAWGSRFGGQAGRKQWRVNADFRTHNDHENWYISVMCLNKAYPTSYQFYRRVRVEPVSSETIDLGYLNIPHTHDCAVAGLAAWNGDIDAGGAGRIIRVYTFIGANQDWFVMADIRSEHVHEVWNINLLCVRRPAADLTGNWAEGWAPYAMGSCHVREVCHALNLDKLCYNTRASARVPPSPGRSHLLL